jgi:hypothetical protein
LPHSRLLLALPLADIFEIVIVTTINPTGWTTATTPTADTCTHATGSSVRAGGLFASKTRALLLGAVFVETASVATGQAGALCLVIVTSAASCGITLITDESGISKVCDGLHVNMNSFVKRGKKSSLPELSFWLREVMDFLCRLS